MEDKRKIDLKQHTSPPVSKRYLVRIIVYIILLVIIAVFLYRGGPGENQNKRSVDSVNQINNITVDSLSDSN